MPAVCLGFILFILVFEPSVIHILNLSIINKRLFQLCVSVCDETAGKAAPGPPACGLDGLQLSLASNAGQASGDQETLCWADGGPA